MAAGAWTVRLDFELLRTERHGLCVRAAREDVPLAGIDITVRRNAFGRQVDSFEGDVSFSGFDEPVHGVFIRAPWVERVGDGVQVLARAAGHPVAVRQGRVLATAFHPEMTGDRRIHRLFVDIVKGRV